MEDVGSLTETYDVVYESGMPLFWLGVFFVLSLFIWVTLVTWSPEWFLKQGYVRDGVTLKGDLDFPKIYIASFVLGGIFTIIFWAASGWR